MSLFKRRYLCMFCGNYHYEESSLYRYKGLCACSECCRMVKTQGDYTFSAKSPISAIISPFEYDGAIKEAIKKYKFAHQRAFGTVMGRMLADEVKDHPYLADYDCVIPVPLYGERRQRRGYNQSEVLAEELAKSLGLEYFNDALFRIKNTKQQSRLYGIDRVENVKDAFFACEKVVSGRNIILVDDVCTRGETIASSARALADAGANMIIGVTLSKTLIKERVYLR